MDGASLGNRKQRIEISFLCNQFIESSRFNNRAIFQRNNAIVLSEQSLIKGVRNHDTRYTFQSENRTGYLTGGFGVQGFIRSGYHTGHTDCFY